jgi:hypothetical protein
MTTPEKHRPVEVSLHRLALALATLFGAVLCYHWPTGAMWYDVLWGSFGRALALYTCAVIGYVVVRWTVRSFIGDKRA